MSGLSRINALFVALAALAAASVAVSRRAKAEARA